MNEKLRITTKIGFFLKPDKTVKAVKLTRAKW